MARKYKNFVNRLSNRESEVYEPESASYRGFMSDPTSQQKYVSYDHERGVSNPISSNRSASKQFNSLRKRGSTDDRLNSSGRGRRSSEDIVEPR